MIEQITDDGFEIVYISDFYFDWLEERLSAIAESPHVQNVFAIRDDPAKVEFRRLRDRPN